MRVRLGSGLGLGSGSGFRLGLGGYRADQLVGGLRQIGPAGAGTSGPAAAAGLCSLVAAAAAAAAAVRPDQITLRWCSSSRRLLLRLLLRLLRLLLRLLLPTRLASPPRQLSSLVPYGLVP